MLHRVLELSAIDLDEIVDALADQDHYEHCRLIDQRTGEITFWTAGTGIDGHNPIDLDELDPDLVVIHPLPSWMWYQDMVDYIETVPAEHARDQLSRAIRGRGAFRRFKDELRRHDPGLLSAWYAFSDSRAQRRAVEWLADQELISDQDAERFLADHVDPGSC